MPVDLTEPESLYVKLDVSGVPDDSNDIPKHELEIGPLGQSRLVFGAGALSHQYNTIQLLHSATPFRSIRLALRYGIRAIDTSPYYGNSEIIVGSALRALSPEFPRSTYHLMSKCGRYSGQHDYAPATIRASLMRSLHRLGTDYLDVLFLHDVEFIASPQQPQSKGGYPVHALQFPENRNSWGLDEENVSKSHGEGDNTILAAFEELRKLKAEGFVRAIGITGYPLPVLFRLSLLIRAHFNEPVDAIMSYSHYNLQNKALVDYLPRFTQDAQISQIYCASPLNMALFTNHTPSWHPAPPGLLQARDKAAAIVESEAWPGGLANIALGFGNRRNPIDNRFLPPDIPTVVGLSKPEEVHEAVRAWREVNDKDYVSAESHNSRHSLEGRVAKCFADAGWSDWSWPSP